MASTSTLSSASASSDEETSGTPLASVPATNSGGESSVTVISISANASLPTGDVLLG